MRARLKLQNRRGASAILLVIMIPVVVGMVALTVDIGHLALEREKLTNVCDACAKAGGIDLPTAASSDVNADLSRAEATAKEYATENGLNLASVQFASDAVRDGNGYALLVTAKEEVPMSFARIFGIDTRPVQAAAKVRREGAPINEETKFVPLAVDSQSFTLGLEADLALSPCAKQHFWRIAIPNTTNADFEAMLRDGVNNEIGVGDTVNLDPDTGAVEAEIQSAVNSLIQEAQTNSAYLQDDITHHSSTNPRIIQVPIVATVSGDNLTQMKQSKIVGFASLWLTGVENHQLEGYFVSQNTSTGHSDPGRPTGEDFQTRGVPLVQ
jgi:Flp pilus assembly protein TadG